MRTCALVWGDVCGPFAASHLPASPAPRSRVAGRERRASGLGVTGSRVECAISGRGPCSVELPSHVDSPTSTGRDLHSRVSVSDSDPTPTSTLCVVSTRDASVASLNDSLSPLHWNPRRNCNSAIATKTCAPGNASATQHARYQNYSAAADIDSRCSPAIHCPPRCCTLGFA